MDRAEELRQLKPKRVQNEVESLLEAELSDTELRDRLEELAQAFAFGGLTWLWGPALYRRNRVVFRPFILNHFATGTWTGSWRWKPVEWKGDIGRRLDAWLQEVDAANDADLFRKLYLWKHQSGTWFGLDRERWHTDLTERFRAAATPAERAAVLEKFDLRAELDESTAITLYELDPRLAGPFILKHLTPVWGENRKLWRKLYELAGRRGDDEFAFKLYRRQIDGASWEKDVLKLAEEISSPQELCDELERRHPQGWGLSLGMTFYRLVERRERDVLPYVQKHLRSVYRSWWGSRDGYKKLVRLAAQHQWWDLWSALVRTCSQHPEFNAEMKRLLNDADRPEEEVKRRLLMLSGVSREWNFGPFAFAQVQQLDDDTAVRLYERFPDLLRGPFKMNVSTGRFGVLPKLTGAVMAAEDETLIDYLASRVIIHADWGWGQEQVEMAERFSKYYERFREDDVEFSRRAVQVLEQVPAYSIMAYGQLIRTNRLARMFYERSASKYLSHPQGVRDLLEAPEIHSQAVAFRVLGLDREESRRLGNQNLDLLQATLLRPLHRKTRMLAFRALANAAIDVDSAQRIHQKCREALDLPDKRYPKEELIGLIGRLLHRWPELRSDSERPVIYGATV